VVDEELRAAVEELGERPGSVLGLEAVILLDWHPRELPSLACELVVAARQLLLLGKQRVSLGLPLFLGRDPVLGHRSDTSFRISHSWRPCRRAAGPCR